MLNLKLWSVSAGLYWFDLSLVYKTYLVGIMSVGFKTEFSFYCYTQYLHGNDSIWFSLMQRAFSKNNYVPNYYRFMYAYNTAD